LTTLVCMFLDCSHVCVSVPKEFACVIRHLSAKQCEWLSHGRPAPFSFYSCFLVYIPPRKLQYTKCCEKSCYNMFTAQLIPTIYYHSLIFSLLLNTTPFPHSCTRIKSWINDSDFHEFLVLVIYDLNEPALGSKSSLHFIKFGPFFTFF